MLSIKMLMHIHTLVKRAKVQPLYLHTFDFWPILAELLLPLTEEEEEALAPGPFLLPPQQKQKMRTPPTMQPRTAITATTMKMV